MARLAGKVAIITGASQGMGETNARMFVREGAQCVLTDINEKAGESLARELGENAVFIRQDVAKDSDWIAVVAEAEKRFGPVNILVNNAGMLGEFTKTLELSEADFTRIWAVNELGVFLGMKRVIPSMLKAGGGSIVNLSSTCGLSAIDGTPNAAYCSTKFAVRGLTRFVAVEHGKDKIRVNSIHPGYIATPMMTDALSPEQIAEATAILPLRRAGAPEEVSNLVLFLASDESAFINGGEHVIDGGLMAN